MASQQKTDFDLIVIGGGPAGYVGAIRAAQLGKSVACVERDALGGVCLNWGCIPTKALLAGAEFYSKLRHDADDWGINAENVGHNWEKVIARSRGVAGNLSKGIGFLFKKNKIAHFDGHAFIPAAGKVQVYDKADTEHKGGIKQELTADKILIATGAVPRELPGAPFAGDRVIAAKEAMTLKDQPKKLLIVGSGAIGMEFAYFYNAFGTECTVVEMLDRVMPIEDADSSKQVQKAFKKQGITVRAGTKVVSAKVAGNGVEVVVEGKDGKQETLKADIALNAVGVVGNVEGVGLETVGVAIERGHIKVDEWMRTNVDGVYAIGDVVGAPWLAHVASMEGVVAAEHLADHAEHPMDYSNIPGCTYCQPQVASVGMTEKAAKEAGYEVKIGKFPFKASGKARAIGHTDGFVKLVIDAKYGEILGGHIVGSEATEMIAEIGLGRAADATGMTVHRTVHAHPTLSEAVMEAAADAYGEALNM